MNLILCHGTNDKENMLKENDFGNDARKELWWDIYCYVAGASSAVFVGILYNEDWLIFPWLFYSIVIYCVYGRWGLYIILCW